MGFAAEKFLLHSFFSVSSDQILWKMIQLLNDNWPRGHEEQSIKNMYMQ